MKAVIAQLAKNIPAHFEKSVPSKGPDKAKGKKHRADDGGGE